MKVNQDMKILKFFTIVIVIGIILVGIIFIVNNKNAETNPLVPIESIASNTSTPIPNSSDVDPILDDNAKYGTINIELLNGRSDCNANVSLFRYSDDDPANSSLVNISGNPLYKPNAAIDGHPYLYKFDKVPYGLYRIVLERNGATQIVFRMLESATDDGILGTYIDDQDMQVPNNVNLSDDTIYGWVRNTKKEYLTGYTVRLYEQNLDGTLYSPPTVKNNPTITQSRPYTGFYAFEGVKPGKYLLSVEMDGIASNSSIFQFDGTDEKGFICNLVYI